MIQVLGLGLILISVALFGGRLLIILVPVLWISGYQRIDVAIVLLLVNIAFKIKLKTVWIVIFLAVAGLLINFKESPIVKVINLKTTANEVNQRFDEENFLNNRVNFNKLEEKIAYNRYFFVVKNVIRGTFKLFDFDNVFFQENNQKFEKSIVMFTWIWIWIFALGVGRFSDFKDKENLWKWIITAIVFFWFFRGPLYIRQIMVIFPVTLIIENGLNYISKNKIIYGLVLVLVVYAFGMSVVDLTKNRDYWLQNLPDYEQNY